MLRAVRASSVAAVAAAAAPLVAQVTSAAISGGGTVAPSVVPEYSFKQFKATMKGAKHVRPETIVREIYKLFIAASKASVPGKPSIPDWKKVEDLVCSTYYIDPNEPDKAKERKPLNDHWPPANGGYQRQIVQLKEGDVFDRYQADVYDKKVDPITRKAISLEAGDTFDVTFAGTFLSPMGQAGTPLVPQSFESRALDRPENKYALAYTVKILKDVPLTLVQGELAQVIPWYGQPGGGTQLRAIFPKRSNWKYKEWKNMQRRNKKAGSKPYAEITLNSSPSGEYETLPSNKAKKRS